MKKKIISALLCVSMVATMVAGCGGSSDTTSADNSNSGVIEGTVYDVAGLNELAKIPSREVLLSKLLGSLQSPITNFARVIKQIAEKDGEATTEAPAEEAAAEE